VSFDLDLVRRWAPVTVTTLVSLALLGLSARWAGRRAAWYVYGGAAAWILTAGLFSSHRVAHRFPAHWTHIVTAGSLLLLFLSFSLALWTVPARPGRRRALRALAAAPVAVTGYGLFLERHRMAAREIDMPIPGLPADLDGLRIAQLTDLHCGVFFSPREVERAVALANEWRPHLTVVTGDNISRAGDPLDECLAALRGLKAGAGVFGCHGNHEVYSAAEEYTSREASRFGLRYLRGETAELRFGGAVLNLAGVDYQRMARPYLTAAPRLLKPGALNLLLSHTPAVFPVAARQGWQLTLTGHTHGGQINVEILEEHLNLARVFTPFVIGRYEIGAARLYVSPGLGTIGVPVRVGAPPEVSLLRLRASA
jgi:hypothetical protein